MTLPTMEQGKKWVRQSKTVSPDEARVALWRRTTSLINAGSPRLRPVGRAAYARDWLRAACRLLKATDAEIIMTDYPVQEVPWHAIAMQLTLAACIAEVASSCGELLKWCHANNAPLVETMEVKTMEVGR